MTIESIKLVKDDNDIWSELLPSLIMYNICVDNVTNIHINEKGIVFRFLQHIPIFYPKRIGLVMNEWTSNESEKK